MPDGHDAVRVEREKNARLTARMADLAMKFSEIERERDEARAALEAARASLSSPSRDAP